jgi:CRP-like cAMP-binding protein
MHSGTFLDRRALLSTSSVIEAPAGAILTKEGEAVPTLAFILSGDVEIRVGENVIGRCKRSDFVGEIGIIGGESATATAVATTPIRYLAFDGAALRKLVARDRSIGHELELAFRHSLREKLMRANASLATVPTGNAAWSALGTPADCADNRSEWRPAIVAAKLGRIEARYRTVEEERIRAAKPIAEEARE